MEDNRNYVLTGDRFWISGFYGPGEYILAQVGPSTFSLIGLKDGNRWCEPVGLDPASKAGGECGVPILKRDFYKLIGDDSPDVNAEDVLKTINMSFYLPPSLFQID